MSLTKFATRIYKELLQISNSYQAKKKYGHSSVQKTPVAYKQKKIYSTSLTIIKVQTKTTVRYHFILIDWRTVPTES